MRNPILVSGAAGPVGAIGRTVTELPMKQGEVARAMVRNEDERAQTLRNIGAEVVVGDLLDLESMHRALGSPEMVHDSRGLKSTWEESEERNHGRT